MAKGYWIVRVDAKDEEGMKPYAAASAAIYKKFGGRYLVRSNKCEVPEGTSRSRVMSLSNFPITLPRSPAIARLNSRQTSKCVSRTQLPISFSNTPSTRTWSPLLMSHAKIGADYACFIVRYDTGRRSRDS
jgi:uncharacterized protein (DUF1330 family)